MLLGLALAFDGRAVETSAQAATFVLNGARGAIIVINDLLCHVVSIANQTRLEVSVEVSGYIVIAISDRTMWLVLPSIVVLAIFVHSSQVIRCNQLGRCTRVQV